MSSVFNALRWLGWYVLSAATLSRVLVFEAKVKLPFHYHSFDLLVCNLIALCFLAVFHGVEGVYCL